MKRKFEKFLQKRKCQKKYKKNFELSEKNITISEYLEKNEPRFYIAGAFIWPEPEFNYWKKHNKKWLKKVRKES